MFLRWAFDDGQPSVGVLFGVDTRPKEMQLGIETTTLRRETLVRCQKERALVIFKEFTSDTRRNRTRRSRHAVEYQCGLDEVT